jgi:hypothetical protein
MCPSLCRVNASALHWANAPQTVGALNFSPNGGGFLGLLPETGILTDGKEKESRLEWQYAQRASFSSPEGDLSVRGW